MPWLGINEACWRRYAWAAAVLATSFVALPLLALLLPILPTPIGRWLFYWPQYALLPSGLRAVGGGPQAVVGSSLTLVAGVFWLAAVAAFVAATRRWRARWVLAALLPVAMVVVALAMTVLQLAGLRPVLDAP